MKKVTVILAHADYGKSVANKTIIESLKKRYPDIRIRNLTKSYSDFFIDIDVEQQNLIESDIIVLQFPLYWYNMPAILKQWFDTILTEGFAYGTNGDHLKGKVLLASITAGGDSDDYTSEGVLHHNLESFFYNLEASARFCQMKYIAPVVGFGYSLNPSIYRTKDDIIVKAKAQADRIMTLIDSL